MFDKRTVRRESHVSTRRQFIYHTSNHGGRVLVTLKHHKPSKSPIEIEVGTEEQACEPCPRRPDLYLASHAGTLAENRKSTSQDEHNW